MTIATQIPASFLSAWTILDHNDNLRGHALKIKGSERQQWPAKWQSFFRSKFCYRGEFSPSSPLHHFWQDQYQKKLKIKIFDFSQNWNSKLKPEVLCHRSAYSWSIHLSCDKSSSRYENKLTFFSNFKYSQFVCKFYAVWASSIYFYERQNTTNTTVLYNSQLHVKHFNNVSVNHKYVSETSMQWEKDRHQSLPIEHILIATTN